MRKPIDESSATLDEITQQLVRERDAVAKILDEITVSKQPMSLFERGKVDDHIDEIKRLSAIYERLQQNREKSHS